MDQDLALSLMRRLEGLDAPIHYIMETIEEIPNSEQRMCFRRAIGMLIGSMFIDLKRPIMKQYPGIEYPDLDWWHNSDEDVDEAPGATSDVTAVSNETALMDKDLAAVLMTKLDDFAAHGPGLHDLIGKIPDADEQLSFKTALASLMAELDVELRAPILKLHPEVRSPEVTD